MLSSPLLSICIPTVGRLDYLREAVASARAQTLSDIEILIGDNAESAEIQSWCELQVRTDPRVRYQKAPRHLRMAEHWNHLVSFARAEYVCVIGDDDRLLPEFAARLVRDANGRVAVVFSNHYVIDTQGQRLESELSATGKRYSRAELASGVVEEPGRFVWRGAVAISACIVRTADVRRLGFKIDINTPELELFVRMAAEGGTFVFAEDYLAEYRVHPGSATAHGLTLDRLAEYLQQVEVSSSVELAKQDCLELMLIAGVGIRLAQGDVHGARSLWASPYYPRFKIDPRVLVHRLMIALPDPLVVPVYSSLRRMDRLLKVLRGRVMAFREGISVRR